MQHMEQAYSEINIDVENVSESLNEKSNKIVQVERDLEQLREKVEHATRKLINYSRKLRLAKSTDSPTLEELDFKLRDMWDFNRNKAKELADIGRQYPLIQQTLNLLFNQVLNKNIFFLNRHYIIF